VRFLGVPHVALDGRPVQLQRQASIALIAYLILTRRPASRLDLAGLLAGESSEASARKLLRNALADLHHGGVGPYLLATRDTVALDLDLPLRVDTEMIDGLVDGWGGASLEELEWAVGHCDVELLAGIELPSAPGFDAWLAN